MALLEELWRRLPESLKTRPPQSLDEIRQVADLVLTAWRSGADLDAALSVGGLSREELALVTLIDGKWLEGLKDYEPAGSPESVWVSFVKVLMEARTGEDQAVERACDWIKGLRGELRYGLGMDPNG